MARRSPCTGRTGATGRSSRCTSTTRRSVSRGLTTVSRAHTEDLLAMTRRCSASSASLSAVSRSVAQSRSPRSGTIALVGLAKSGDEMRKSAVATFDAIGMFHTAPMRNSALTSGSCGCASSGSQKKIRVSMLAFRDFRADLLVAADRTRQEAVDLEPQLEFEHGTRGACRVEVMLGQGAGVEPRPLEQLDLLVVVGDEGDVALRLRWCVSRWSRPCVQYCARVRFAPHSGGRDIALRGWLRAVIPAAVLSSSRRRLRVRQDHPCRRCRQRAPPP